MAPAHHVHAFRALLVADAITKLARADRVLEVAGELAALDHRVVDLALEEAEAVAAAALGAMQRHVRVDEQRFARQAVLGKQADADARGDVEHRAAERDRLADAVEELVGEARGARRLLLDGIDPLEARKAEKAARALEAAKAITFEKAARDYFDQHESSDPVALRAAMQ